MRLMAESVLWRISLRLIEPCRGGAEIDRRGGLGALRVELQLTYPIEIQRADLAQGERLP